MSRVMYQTSPPGKTFWAEVVDLESFCSAQKTVEPKVFQSIVGNFTETVSELPSAFKALAEVENVKTICLFLGQPLLDFNASQIPTWHGGWAAVEHGYVFAAAKTSKSDVEVSRMLDNCKKNWQKKPHFNTVLTAADPYAHLAPVPSNDEKCSKALDGMPVGFGGSVL